MAENSLLQLVSFEVGKECFAVPITKIQEIIRITNIVTIPKSPEFVEGVINLRGKVIPVVDLKKRFVLPEKEHDSRTRIVVAEIEGLTIGLIVDAVAEVMRAEASSFEKTPSLVAGVEQRFIEGIVKDGEQMFIVLDLDKLFSLSEANLLKTVK